MTPPAAPPPRVTVVIPAYNRARIVPDAIDSVLAQTFRDFELLLVDDGSSDDTGDMVRARYGGEPRVRYVWKRNGGSADARNHGISLARGEFVAFLDDDDRWLPGFLASQVALLEREPDATLAICDAHFEGAWDGRGPTLFGDRDFRPPTSMDSMIEGAWAIPTAWCVRLARLGRVRFSSRYTYCEDTEFLFRLASVGARVVLNPDLQAVYRWHREAPGAPMKSSSRPLHVVSHLQLLRDYARFAPDPHRLGERVSIQSRAEARILVAEGRWADARPLLWIWLKRHPDSTHAWRWWIRSLFSRRKPHGSSASPSASSKAAGS